ncbi:MAG: hypothetical protein STSR0004_19980 [Peptococcaceae bacterium]
MCLSSKIPKKSMVLMFVLLVSCLLLFVPLALAGQDLTSEVNSSERPADISLEDLLAPEPEPVSADLGASDPYIDPKIPDLEGILGTPFSYNLHPHEKGGTCVGKPKILLVQDADSWQTGYQNEKELQKLGLSFDKIKSSQLINTDLYKYSHLLVPSDQPQAFYNNLDANMDRITKWVEAGGSFQFNACDVGWANGHWAKGPGGITHKYPVYVQQNYIQSPAHPVLQGQTNADFYNWNYVSHGYFENLPPGTQVLLSVKPDGSQPTLVDFKLGKGHVVASQNTLEWTNAKKGYKWNELILDKIILYMFGAGFDCLQWSVSGVDENIIKVAIDTDKDVMTITPIAEGKDEITLTLKDTLTGKTASQNIWVTIKKGGGPDITPPKLEVSFPPDCLPEPGPYLLKGRAEKDDAVKILVNNEAVEIYDYDHFWAYFRKELKLVLGDNKVVVQAWDKAGNKAEVIGVICVGQIPKTIVEAGKKCGPPGAEIKVPITIQNANGMAGAQFDLNYKPEVAVATAVEIGDLVKDFMLAANLSEAANGKVRIGLVGAKGVTGNGTLVVVTFKLTGKMGDKTPLKILNLELNDEKGNPIKAAVKDGEVGICLTCGDVNGDEKVSAADATLTLRAAVGLQKLTYEQICAANVNCDQKITAADVTLILRKAVGLVKELNCCCIEPQ